MPVRNNIFNEFADSIGIPDMGLRILDAAMTLFAQKGYAATSVREIVQMAEATNPMLYYYFNNKEGVFLKLIEIMHGLLEESIAQAIEQSASFEQKIYALIDLHFDAFHEAPHAVRFMYAASFSARDSRPDFDAFSKRQRGIALLTKMFDDAVEAGEFTPTEGLSTTFLATQLLGTLSQSVMLAVAQHNSINHEAIIEKEDSADAMCLLGQHARKQVFLCFFQGAGQLK